jgi:hypothetical protein
MFEYKANELVFEIRKRKGLKVELPKLEDYIDWYINNMDLICLYEGHRETPMEVEYVCLSKDCPILSRKMCK